MVSRREIAATWWGNRGRVLVTLAFCALLALAAAAHKTSEPPNTVVKKSAENPCSVMLAEHEGTGRLDVQIQRLQAELRQPRQSEGRIERLGWLYVSKARTTSDLGYYLLAQYSADCLSERNPDSTAAMLLNGHVLHNMHRFQEAESVARELVKRRGLPFDYGLLGDVLMEQGMLEEAADAYQKMADLKPGMQSYLRAAHLRWLYGDLPGAVTLMRMAARAAGPRTREPGAWSYSRLALYELQAGRTEAAAKAADAAVALQDNHGAALMAQARVLLARQKSDEALEAVTRAAKITRLPEHQWLRADILRRVGRSDEAQQVEERLTKAGAVKDPRVLALYLATRSQQPDLAAKLAASELESRRDIFTYDALAWAQHAAGRVRNARSSMKRALEFGTEDARLFLHAALIAESAGETAEASRFLEKVGAVRQMLFPSEHELLFSAEKRLLARAD